MDSSTAELVLYGITAVSVVVWMAGLRFLLSSLCGRKKTVEGLADPAEQARANLAYGSVEVECSASELSSRAAALLAAKSMLICERTDEKIVFETPKEFVAEGAACEPMTPSFPASVNQLGMQKRTGRLPSIHGQLHFTPLSSGKTRVDYAIAVPRVRLFLILGYVFEALGILAIITGFSVIYFFVIPSPDTAVRWQTLQMIQVIHFLWPPFLFAYIYRKSASIIRVQFDTFIHNLPFLRA
jgi:hypothetical protein